MKWLWITFEENLSIKLLRVLFYFYKLIMEKNDQQKINKPWWQDSVTLFAQLSGWIGIPVILGVFLGKWLDNRYHTEPWLFLLTVGVAFVISTVGIVKEANSAMSRIAGGEKPIDQDIKNKKNETGK